MNKIKNILKMIKENIFTIIIILFLLYAVITVKYSPKNSIELLYQYMIICMIGLIIAIKMFINKKAIIVSKLDIYIFGLTIASALPIIFQRAVCINDAVSMLNQYTVLLEFYIIVKQICLKNDKIKDILINTTILLTILVIFIGIDKMTTNIFNSTSNVTTRLESVFLSPNALATLIGGTIFLAFGQLLKENKQSFKALYIIAISILSSGLILTYSRFMYVIFFMTMIIYCLSIKEKKVMFKIIIVTFFSLLFGVIYSKLYSETLILEKYWQIWLGLIVNTLIVSVICIIAINYSNRLKKINMKKCMIIFALIIIIVVVYFVCSIRISKPLILFNSNTSSNKLEKSIYNIKGNCKYVFEFDIESQSQSDSAYKIIIVERNKYMDYINGSEIALGKFSGTKSIEVQTLDTTTSLHILFKNETTSENSYLKINKLKVNDKEIILNYKYLPTSIMDRLSNVGTNNKNLWERVTFYKDAIKIIKKDGNWLFGIGGNGWKYKYLEEQSYTYTSTDVHNYPLQIVLEFGIIGFGFFLAVIILIIKKLIYAIWNNEYVKISLIYAIFCILIHSCFEYSMSYFYMLIVLYLLLAVIDTDKNNSSENIKFKNLLSMIFSIIIIGAFIGNVSYSIYLINDKTIMNKEKGERLNIYEKVSNIFLWDIQLKEKVLILTEDKEKRLTNFKYLFNNEAYYIAEYDFIAYSVDGYVMECLNNKENINNLLAIKQYYNKTKEIKKFSFRYQINRLYQIINIGDLIMEYNKKINNDELYKLGISMYKDALNELESKKRYMLDYENGRYDKDNIPVYENEIEELVKSINKRSVYFN